MVSKTLWAEESEVSLITTEMTLDLWEHQHRTSDP